MFEWTHKRPTKCGYYWINDTEGTIDIVLIRPYNKNYEWFDCKPDINEVMHGELFVEEMGDNEARFLNTKYWANCLFSNEQIQEPNIPIDAHMEAI